MEKTGCEYFIHSPTHLLITSNNWVGNILKVKDDIIRLEQLTRNCCVCVKLLSALCSLRGNFIPVEGNSSTGLSSWQSFKPPAGPLQVFGKHSPASGLSKVVLLESVVRGICTPCLWTPKEVWGQLSLAVRENKVFYSSRLKIMFETKLQKQNKKWIIVLVSLLNR